MSPSYRWGMWSSELAHGCLVSALWLAPAYLASLSLLSCHPGFLSSNSPSSFSFRTFAYAVPSPWRSSPFIFTDALLFMFLLW